MLCKNMQTQSDVLHLSQTTKKITYNPILKTFYEINYIVCSINKGANPAKKVGIQNETFLDFPRFGDLEVRNL